MGFPLRECSPLGLESPKAYLKELLDAEIHTIVLESLNQARWLNELAQEYKKHPNVLLRIQLPWTEGTSVLGGGEITPFGLPPSTWASLTKKDRTHLNILGFHCFQWGNLLCEGQLRHIWWETGREALALSERMGISPKVMDLGGGLGLPYSDQERALPFEKVAKLLEDFQKAFPFQEIWMELGRFLVGPCGFYLTKALDRKSVFEREILVTEGGINHLLRPLLTKQSFPASLIRKSSSQNRNFHVHGPLCTALDFLGIFEFPEDIAPGDWLIFSQCGAYGLTESMPFFLCHDLPGEWVISKDVVNLVRGPTSSEFWTR